ncbi:MAG: NAD-dependent epimerase/dehydratase family protein [Phenylobacterium sp.]|uniref:NAD-dependent epimerase/dehydratase family protein n=1 Tax=Phenylobacterium sp. TaxID=1871053 RepID=UPI00391D3777
MKKLVIAGAAGLVGQNLVPRLKGAYDIVAIDKHAANLAVLRRLHPDIEVIEADMAEPGRWQEAVANAEALVMLQAQIGGLDPKPFERNNIASSRLALAAAEGGACRYLVHVSSSVVNSMAVDLYTESKKAQEAVVAASSIKHVILRPTLMFGWFDRKHLGWLRRFMDRAQVFPVPGDGKFLRQPLYAGDFAAICAACVEREIEGAYNISGLETIDYIDLIRLVREVTGSRTPVVKIPFWLFGALLRAYALVDRNPPFTVAQLKALATPDVFEVIDWPGIFGVQATPLRRALEETFTHPQYADVVLEF